MEAFDIQEWLYGVWLFIEEHPWQVFVFFVLLFGSRLSVEEDNEFKGVRLRLGNYPMRALSHLFMRVEQILKADDANDKDTLAFPDNTLDVMKEMNGVIVSTVNQKKYGLQKHIDGILSVIEKDKELRVWRVVGGLVSAVLLVLFIYADLVQGINNIAEVEPDVFSDVPSWLGNLTLAVLVGSIGTTFTLALIIIDCIGITHFIPWETSLLDFKRQNDGTTTSPEDQKVNWGRRNKIRYFAAFLLIFNLALVILTAAARMISAPGVDLPEHVMLWLYRASAIAQSLTILPMLLTTLLLFWGVVGIVIVYVGFLWVVFFAIEGVLGLLFLLSTLLQLLSPAATLLTRTILIFFGFSFSLLGLVLGTMLSIAEQVSYIIEVAVQTIIIIFAAIFAVPATLARWVKGGLSRVGRVMMRGRTRQA